MNIAIVVSDFNYDVTHQMLDRALKCAESLGVQASRVVHVPGVYDMGPAIKKLLRRSDVDGVVLIGAVIKGETKHDEIITHAVAQVAANLAVQFDKPVGLGVTGPGMDKTKALNRIQRAANAVESVVKMVRILKGLDD